MTVPLAFHQAGRDFDRFLVVLMEESGLTTRHQVYTTAEGVLRTFRRRLDLREALRFAEALPPPLRAMFVSGWNIDEPRRPFGDRQAMTVEVQDLRREHNISPDSAIRDTARALRAVVDRAALERVLATLPEGAAEFWSV